MMNFYSNTEGSLDLKRSYVFTLLTVLTLGRTRKFIPPPWYRVGGGGVDGTPPRSFLYVAVFRKDFTFNGRPLTFLSR